MTLTEGNRLIGTKLGPYEVVEEIGKGGMATVYRAFQPNMERFVAVKVIRQSIVGIPGALERFHREARLIARLEHPHLLPVYDFDGTQDPPYIVIRYLEGATLGEIMARRQLPFGEVAHILRQICSGLDYAHRQGIVHRDIKPSNIMVDQEGNVFVTDFGIARIAGEGESAQAITQVGSRVGTPDYMAPEQGHGSRDIDHRADIYSLGVMLFEMSAGALPFKGETPLATILKHVQEPVPRVSELNSDLPSELDQVLKTAMAKQADDRYQSVNDFSAAVLKILQGQVTHTPVVLQEAARQTIETMVTERRTKQNQIEATLADFAARRGSNEIDTDSERKHVRQNKQVTVLYADYSEYSDILYESEKDNEEVERRMRALANRLRKEIARQGGSVEDEQIGRVTALWGIDATREDDPERAIHSSLAIHEAVRATTEDLLEEDEELPLRLCVNTGLVMLTPTEGGGYQASGAAINIANRLSQASDGTVLIAHDTFRHVRGVFDIEEDAPVKVRGRKSRIQTYRVTGTKERAFRLDSRGVEGVETQMVGRQSEFDLLKELTHAVKEDGETQIATVVGEAGTGKSRLLYEWMNWEELLPDDMWGFQGRGTRDTMDVPYALIRALFAFRFSVQETDTPADVREKFERGVDKFLGPGNQETAHLIGQLCGFDFADSPYLEGIIEDPKRLHDRALQAIGDFFRGLAGREDNSTFLFLEDMHWADDRSLDVINHLVEDNQDLYLLVIGAARQEIYQRRPHWGSGQEFHTRIELRPLSRRESRTLVKKILAKVEHVPKGLRDLIVERSEGNPFYIEELVKMLLEDRVIVKQKTGQPEESWQVQMDRLANVSVPPTLQGLIQARLDSLFPAEQTLLQRASVVGRTFWDSALERLQQEDGIQIDIAATLTQLRDRELILAREESTFQGSLEYIFGNNMLRDVLYEGMLKSQQSGYHKRVADWLIDASGDRSEEYTAVIAQHYSIAGENLLAAGFFQRSGEQALQIGAYQEAVAFLERGLPLIETLSDTASKKRMSSLRQRLGLVYEDLGQRDQAVRHLEQSLAIARELEDREAILETTNILGQVTGKAGHFEDSHAYLAEALSLAEALGDKGGMAHALLWSGANVHVQGDCASGLEYLNKALPLAEASGDQLLIARTWNVLGEIRRRSGQLQEAEDCYVQAATIYRRLGNQFGTGLTTGNLGHVALERDDYREASRHYLEALATVTRIGAVPVALEVVAGVAAVRARSGDPEGAVELLALATRHPLTDVDTKRFAEPILEKLEKEIADETFQAALSRGEALKLEDALEELLP